MPADELADARRHAVRAELEYNRNSTPANKRKFEASKERLNRATERLRRSEW